MNFFKGGRVDALSRILVVANASKQSNSTHNKRTENIFRRRHLDTRIVKTRQSPMLTSRGRKRKSHPVVVDCARHGKLNFIEIWYDEDYFPSCRRLRFLEQMRHGRRVLRSVQVWGSPPITEERLSLAEAKRRKLFTFNSKQLQLKNKQFQFNYDSAEWKSGCRNGSWWRAVCFLLVVLQIVCELFSSFYEKSFSPSFCVSTSSWGENEIFKLLMYDGCGRSFFSMEIEISVNLQVSLRLRSFCWKFCYCQKKFKPQKLLTEARLTETSLGWKVSQRLHHPPLNQSFAYFLISFRVSVSKHIRKFAFYDIH